MPFIGTQPEVGGYSVLDALTASATASYTLQLNSANFSPSSANQLLVSLNGVIQKPGSSFTVSGSTLTFSSALDSSDSIDFIISMGEPLLIGTPSDATVTGNKLASNIGISTTGNIATTGSGTLSVAGTSTLTGNTTVAGTLTNTGLITASSGIAIGGTGAVNTLDDYEEGTWTPTVTAGGSSMSYSVQHGNYTKIGDICYAQFYLAANGGTMAGSVLKIGPLPFTSAANHYVVASGYSNASSGSVPRPQPILFPNDTNIWFYEQGGNGVSQVTGSTFGNNLSQLWNLTYRVA